MYRRKKDKLYWRKKDKLYWRKKDRYNKRENEIFEAVYSCPDKNYFLLYRRKSSKFCSKKLVEYPLLLTSYYFYFLEILIERERTSQRLVLSLVG